MDSTKITGYEIRQATFSDIAALIRMQLALQFFRANRIDLLVVNYVDGNAIGERLWKRLGFEPVVVTATADRADVERTLGLPRQQVIPAAYRSVLAGKASVRMPPVPAL